MNKRVRITGILVIAALLCGCVDEAGQRSGRVKDSVEGQGGSAIAAIRLTGIGEPLSLPGPRGANRILTARIAGATAKRVWLAPSAPSSPSVPLTRVGAGEYEINLFGHEVYDALKNAGDAEFRVVAELANGSQTRSIPVRYTIDALPARLVFPWDKATMTVYQRSTREIPGSGGKLHLHLGDITARHVLVSVSGSDGESVVDMQATRQGQAVPLVLEEARYVLVLEKLVNLLAGRDYAVFRVMPAATWEREKIDRLLDAIESADVAFIREGVEVKGAVFAEWLRLKLEHARPSVTSFDDFIERIARRSSTTGNPYHAKLGNGDIVDIATWLQERAKEITDRAEGKVKSQGISTSEPAGTAAVDEPP